MSGPFDTDSFRLGRLLNRISGTLSILGSLYIIQSVLRDSKRRQKVANQVVVALSFADLISSFFGSILGQWPAPKGTAQGAIGNVGTCATVGFISQFSFILSTYLNASLAITYLLMIKYGWKEEKLRKHKLYLILIPIALTLPFAITCTALGGGNFVGNFCSNLAASPAWCMEDPSTCIRGQKLAELPLIRLISATLQTVLSLPIIVGCMILLYLAVLNIEKKNDKYRFDGELNRKQSKQIAIQGIYYVWAFLIVEAMWCAIIIVALITNLSGDLYEKFNASASFFVPLQGFFNAMVYLRPSYMEYLRENPEKTIPNQIRRLFGIKVIIPAAEGSSNISSRRTNKNTNSDNNNKVISKNFDNYTHSGNNGAAHGLCSGDDSQISNNNNSHHYFSNTTTISSSRSPAGEDTNQGSTPSRIKTTSAAMSLTSSTLPHPPPCITNYSQQALAIQEEHEQNHASPQIQSVTTITTTNHDSKMKSSLTSPVLSPSLPTVTWKTTNFAGRVINIESDDGRHGDDDYDEKL